MIQFIVILFHVANIVFFKNLHIFYHKIKQIHTVLKETAFRIFS